MNTTENILKKITDIVETYQSGAYSDLFEMQRELSCSLFFLSQKQVEYNLQWNEVYHNHKSTVNAVKQRHADKEVPELYMCRKIMESAKNVSIAMSLEIKMN